MRFALALLLLVHGIAHLGEFAGSFRLGLAAEIPYRTTVLHGRVDVGDGGIRLLGVVWLALAVVFVVVGTGAALDTTWWVGVAAVATMTSLLMTLLDTPRTHIGLWMNIGILAALLLSY